MGSLSRLGEGQGEGDEGWMPYDLYVVSIKDVCQSKQQETRQERAMKGRKRTEFGQYIVADPEICHGLLTFKGTRIMVKSVLEMLAKGYDWDRIAAEYNGRVDHNAIAEVVKLAGEALIGKFERRRRAA
jgi:uncharacterized protein (DUF433 family)